MPDRRDPALFHEEFYGLQRPARKWRALEPFGVVLELLGHVSSERREGAARHAAVLRLPGEEIMKRKSVARVGGEKARKVKNHERQNHLHERNFVHRDPAVRKMRGRIDMGAILPNHFVKSGAKTVLLDRKGCFGLGVDGGTHPCLSEARPDRRVRAKGMGEIDENL